MITIDSLRALGGKITYSPVGVIRYEYAKDRMYHFFSERAPAVLVDNIHTHPHSFTSTVLRGGIRNHLYCVEDSVEETEYCIRSVGFRTSSKEVKTEQANVTHKEVVTFDTYEGGEYQIGHTAMHMIDILEPKTITHLVCSPHIGAIGSVYFVMKKGVVYKREELHRLKPISECWEIIEDTLT